MYENMFNSCTQDELVDPDEEQSHEAELLNLVLEYNGKDYTATINDTQVNINEEVAYNPTGNMTIKSIKVSDNAKSNINAGQNFDINNPPQIVVSSQNGQTQKTYTINVNKDKDGDLLINHFTRKACNKYENIWFDELLLENNVWNSSGSFSQCVYLREQGNNKTYGWQWSYSTNANGVNAFPEVIYGWKPWKDKSSNNKLPKELSQINKLKVTYDVEVYRNNGSYNLAFDNWITASSSVTPQNAKFEFMIWEDSNNLNPFGDFQEEVKVSNGTYKFYRGEPTWEPAGCNWTYLAFVRTEKRSSGTVDVDELLKYLINKGIVPQNSYLSSIELGNEVGNSSGYAVVKQFEVDIK